MTEHEIDFKRNSGFSVRLKKLIGGMSARAFARASGVDDKSIRKYLSGEAEPTLKNLVKLSEAGGVSVQWLATGDEPDSVKEAYDVIEDRRIQKIVQLLSKLPNEDRKEILSRAESLYKVDQQQKELAALKEVVAKIMNDG